MGAPRKETDVSSEGLSNAEMITALYLAFLNREPEPSALTYFANALMEGALDERSLIATFQNCNEYRQRRSKSSLLFPPGHYYSPIVDVDQLRADAARVFDRSRPAAGIDLNQTGQLALLPMLRSLAHEIVLPETKTHGMYYYSDNGQYGPGDAAVLASMIRYYRPRRILEFGSGHSSCCILDINRLYFGGNIECTFVDPHPQRLRELLTGYTGCARMLETRAQDIDIKLVTSLEKNDILFIDSTHVSKGGSDVNFHFFSTLPALQTGVIIHFHDVFYPFEYPTEWFFDENRSWSELYVLRAFLMHNTMYRIEFFNHFLAHVHPDIANTFPGFKQNCGGALWLRKCGVT
jgi:hypothetical protein